MLVADFHADAHFMPPARARQVVELVNSVDDVDMIAMPGDFIGHDVNAIDGLAAELARLDAPAFASLGNHDHYEGAGRVTAALEGAGIDVLTDQAVPFGDHGIWIIGLDSCEAGVAAPGLVRSLVPGDARCVVLGHEPFLATRHQEALHLAGHTHHGQVRIPGIPLRYLPRYSRPYPEGLARVDAPSGGRFVYTTAGVGSTTLPIRIGAPPEIVVIDA